MTYDAILARARELYDEMPPGLDWAGLLVELERLCVLRSLPMFGGPTEPDARDRDLRNATARCIAILLRLAVRGT